MTIAIYAFSGDPITYGHMDIIRRAKQVFDKVIVAIGENPDKKYTFNLAEREQMARRCFSCDDGSISVCSFSNLLVDFAYEQGANVIVKGVRNSADFDYENVLHSVGQSQKIGIDTHILFADPELSHISSSAVKSIAKHSGEITEYVPLHVKQAIEEKVCNQHIVGVTGSIGCGKSHLSKIVADSSGGKIHNIELDHIGHDILCKLTEPSYVRVREEIRDKIGDHILNTDGFVSREVLGSIVFNDRVKLQMLNKILAKPIMVRLRKEISGKEGVILINCALLAESSMLHICNNNVILINVSKETQERRLLNRGLSEEQIKTRLDCQHTYDRKKYQIEQSIEYNKHGHLWNIDNSNDINNAKIKEKFDKILFGELNVWL